MPSPSFRFKRFTLWHDRCAMKVGTDGVLLGAWAEPGTAQDVLDIGAGSGLIALMMAQKGAPRVVAVELDGPSAEQAAQNVLQSPWPGVVRVWQGRFQDYPEDRRFGLLVSNPPFFEAGRGAKADARAAARQNLSLGFEDLLAKSARLLEPQGRLCVVLPEQACPAFLKLARAVGLWPIRSRRVCPKPGAPPKRVLLELSGQDLSHVEEPSLVIEDGGRLRFTEDYRRLAKDFYLDF